MPRISLRLNGTDSGCIAKLPDSFAALLALARPLGLIGIELTTRKVRQLAPARHVAAAATGVGR